MPEQLDDADRYWEDKFNKWRSAVPEQRAVYAYQQHAEFNKWRSAVPEQP